MNAAEAGEIHLRLDDYAELQRDLGHDQASTVQTLVAARLQQELGRFDELLPLADGMLRIVVRDAEAVDLEKLSTHLVQTVEADPVTLRRSLIECRASAKVLSTGTEPVLRVATV